MKPATLVTGFEIFPCTHNLLNKDDPNLMQKLLKLHIFAEVARIPLLADQIFDAVMTVSDETGEIPTSMFRQVWENASSSSVLQETDDLPDELLLAVVVAIKKMLEQYEIAGPDKVVEQLLNISTDYFPEETK
ncbi:unnamed protein product [Diplocarpon coronariae]|nr:hypothetical protein JHW43_007632 [Diplocarpon mali]